MQGQGGLAQDRYIVGAYYRDVVQADVALLEGVVAQRFAGGQAGTVETRHAELVRFAHSDYQDALGGDSGRLVDQGDLAGTGMDVAAFQHISDQAAAGVVDGFRQAAERAAFRGCDHQAACPDFAKVCFVQVQFHVLFPFSYG